MKRVFNNLLICLFAYLLIGGLLSPTPAYAQFGWRDSSFGSEYDAADAQGEVNAGAYVDRSVKGNLTSISCMIMPVGESQPGAEDGPCTNDEYTLQLLYQRSAIGSLNRYIATMYKSPPADLALWIRDTGQTLGFFPKQVYAQGQGIGFTGLTAILPLWKAFRNIAYLLLAVVMIVIGFMVMLRKKIDPKTVVTVQNALPKIIITLLLITFSYAIVGIMIDLMYLVILLVVSMLGGGLQGVPILDLQATFIQGGLGKLFGAVFDPVTAMSRDIFNPLPELLAGDFGNALLEIAGLLLPINPLIMTILAVAFLFAFVRIFFMLLSSYIAIIVSVIVGPLQLLAEAIPGSTAFSSWFKNLLANIAVFPITAALLLIGGVINENIGTSTLWAPPLLPWYSDDVAKALISLGVILTIPTMAGSIKEALKAKPAVPAGVGAVFGPLGAGAGQAFQLGYQGMFIASPFIKKIKESTPPGRAIESQADGIEGAIKGGKG